MVLHAPRASSSGGPRAPLDVVLVAPGSSVDDTPGPFVGADRGADAYPATAASVTARQRIAARMIGVVDSLGNQLKSPRAFRLASGADELAEPSGQAQMVLLRHNCLG